jgi:NAD(P)-dependent dehydrogenase (short-subunit alcohol dehydrogenase family)
METIVHDIAGRVALITGANRDGVGRAIARRLASHGVKVVLHSSGRTPNDLEETQKLINDCNGISATIVADLGDGVARADLIARASEHFGSIDILINNAAANPAYAPPSKIDLPARRATFEINFHAPIDLIQQALPAMRRGGWGRIVNISSNTVKSPVFPFSGSPKFLHALGLYGSSKTALERYTTGLAAELHETGITVNATKPYKIAWSNTADMVAKQALVNNPDWVEPLEMLAEATYILVSGSITGVILDSSEVLYLRQSKFHDYSGITVLGDATTVLDIEQIK